MAEQAKREDVKRADLGFQGGQVLSVRVTKQEYESLRSALENERSDRWYELKTQDSDISVDLSQVVYVRIDTEDQRVGF
jgi:hypothetical protein